MSVDLSKRSLFDPEAEIQGPPQKLTQALSSEKLDKKSWSEYSPAGRCRMRWIVLFLGTIVACGCADQRADLQTQAAQQQEQMQGYNNDLLGSSRHPSWFQ